MYDILNIVEVIQ